MKEYKEAKEMIEKMRGIANSYKIPELFKLAGDIGRIIDILYQQQVSTAVSKEAEMERQSREFGNSCIVVKLGVASSARN